MEGAQILDKSIILNRINELRKERHWTINELSMRTDLSSGTIYEWFNTKKNRIPSLSGIESICAAFEISLSTFFSNDDKSRLTAKQNDLLEISKNLSEDNLNALILMAKALDKNN